MATLTGSRIADEAFATLLEAANTDAPRATAGEARPVKDLTNDGTFLLGSLQHPRYRLKRSIRLNLSVADEQIVLTWPEASSLFGYGDTLSAAVTDFRLALIELFESLVEVGSSDLTQSIAQIKTLLESNVGIIDLGT